MKTDRELLELAAKASGLDFNPLWFDPGSGLLVWDASIGKFESEDWNPLADDGDALRLAMAVGISVNPGRKMTVCAKARKDKGGWFHQMIGDDLPAATRRVIVLAAAEIGASA